MSACYISIDDLKQNIEGYSPERAEEFHVASAKLANKLFDEKIISEPIETVTLLCGGSASGKTEYYSEYLANQNYIVFDSTLPTIEGAKIKLRNIEKAKKKPVIIAVLPDDLQRSFAAFLGRDRTFGEEYFYRTHSGSRKTLLWIAKEKENVEIQIYESAYKNGSLNFSQYKFDNRDKLIAFLEGIQYTEDDIENIIQASTP